MGSKLRDRARKAREKEATVDPKAPGEKARKPRGGQTKAEVIEEANASTPPTTESTTEDEGSDPQASSPVDTPDDSPPEDNVVPIGSKAVEALSDAQVTEALAGQATPVFEPGTALLTATRETKRNQIQYDGVTEDGFVIRVWAPEGSPMLIGVTLEQAERSAAVV